MNKQPVLIAIAFALLFGACSGNKSNQANHQQDMNNNDTIPQKTFLFGDDPGFAQCHASTLIHLKNGTFITAWFGGTKEGADDVGIWMSRGKPRQWEKPFEVAKIKIERAH